MNAESIDLGTFNLGRTRTLLTNDSSRLVFELREVAAYGGSFTRMSAAQTSMICAWPLIFAMLSFRIIPFEECMLQKMSGQFCMCTSTMCS